jgi:hypothetical protein
MTTIQWIQQKPSRSHFVLLISTLIILLGGCVTLLWQIHQGTSSRADGGDIVGPPTLPAETIDKIFAEVGSPMVGTGKVVEQAARKANIDDAFALAVWWVETNDGEAGVGLNNRNPGAVASTNGFIFYPSYADAAIDWFSVLRSRYVNQGLTSVYTICYPYVATSHAPEWANKVVTYMLRYRSEAPAPTPTPTMDHAPIYPQFMPSHETSVGEDRKAEARMPMPTPATQPANGIPGLASMQMSSAQNSLLLTIGGLLVVLALVLVGLRIRRRIPMVPALKPVTEALEPAISLPPLYVNQYSPIAEPVSSPSVPWQIEFQNVQGIVGYSRGNGSAEPISSAEGLLVTSIVGSMASADGFLHSSVSGSVVEIDGVPQLSFDEPVSTVQAPQPSLRSGGEPGKLRARRLVQMSPGGGYPVTEMLPPLSRPGLSLPGRLPEPVAVGAGASLSGSEPELVGVGAGTRPVGGGLLRRYGMEQAG